MRIDPSIWSNIEPPPAAVGWCAVLVCWDDPEEGSELFPQALYWSGARFDADEEGGRTHDPVVAWHGPHGSAQHARTFAWEHDPDRAGAMTDDEAGDLEENNEL